MINTVNPKKLIQEFVADDYKTAAVFSKYGIDFCCRGNRSIEDVCEQEQIDKDALLNDLASISQTSSAQSIDYKSWPLDLLIDFIEKKHHRYVTEKSPVINFYLDKIARVHGERHPELFEIKELFRESAENLGSHMVEEEGMFFPYIKRMLEAKENGTAPAKPEGLETVERPIAKLMEEHDDEGVRHREIAKLSNNFTTPEDGCNTYKVAFEMLRDFQDDLHLHIHLENNILFLEAKKLEDSLSVLVN
ncbi:iron-sulfur cluster repair di-iron protein [Aequorivita sp. H23M31]|uniref:Iron-sulfur cluster repair di-iron protein n=1 Tax=Aequorivita ciconiae TaxID=2494375 RepID=A0A410G322_9FLAO|nr:iron-sulfur cluster repair di-iron protein [Aequorivita sp. H23M31]QAA81674.1 iron-sulfur cluster repair di-iron protein [Aequorivita sp. H23M31]